MRCRHCSLEVIQNFIDLGASPPSNAYLSVDALSKPETYFPLRVLVCNNCWLVQTEDFASAEELFNHGYAYFSSISQSWLKHAADYTKMISRRLQLGAESLVIEIAANDGYLLKNFVAAGIPCLGIEPTLSTAQAAEKVGVPIVREFFGVRLAQELVKTASKADLIIGNNVFAHVPDINDFAKGMVLLLKQGGTITLEFPHLMRLIEFNQFDTIYHEHFSYVSLHSAASIFSSVGLRIFDVEELPTHGGSLRIYGCHQDDERKSTTQLLRLFAAEKDAGLLKPEIYRAFQRRANKAKNDFVAFLIAKKAEGKKVAGYGAAAKGNTLLNYAGIKQDLLEFVCDAAPSKKGLFLPGSRIPIVDPASLKKARPDYIVIFPWNIVDEVVKLHAYVSEWGAKFVVAIPTLNVLQ